MTVMHRHPQRIVFLTGAFPRLPCGVGDYTYSLLTNLSTYKNLDIHVLTVQNPRVITTEEVQGAFQIHSVIPSWSIRNLLVIARHIRQLDPDIVHIQYPSTFGKANRAIAANLLGIVARQASRKHTKIVTTLHEFGERSWRWRLRAMANVLTSDAIICINRFDVPSIIKLTLRNKLVIHIPLASAIPFISITQEQRHNIRQSLGIADSEVLLAHFGFITKFKGFDVLLAALGKLKEEGFPVKLLIITHLSTGENEYHQQMFNLMRRLDIQDVCLLGERHYSEEEVSTYLQIADMAVLPYPEGASERRSSLVAALQHRLPVITTLGPNMPSDFLNGKNMLLVAPDNPDVIVSAVSALIDNPDFMRNIAGEASKMSCNFSWRETAKLTAQFYDKL